MSKKIKFHLLSASWEPDLFETYPPGTYKYGSHGSLTLVLHVHELIGKWTMNSIVKIVTKKLFTAKCPHCGDRFVVPETDE